LTAFPARTEFIVVDDIDRSLLLIANVRCGVPSKPFDPRNFHIAVWYEDLIELENRGFVTGIEGVTERKWRQRKWSDVRSRVPPGTEIGHLDANGQFTPLKEPSLENYEDDVGWAPFVVSAEGRITVTEQGRRFLLTELRAENVEFSTAISPRVARLFELGFFDACIREACVHLEHEIKVRITSDEWGDKLTESFINALRTKKQFLESYVRTLRQELRTVFKLIRNDYMHNLLDADEVTAYTILVRIARIRSMLDTD
jgi:hypothetical protein